MRFLLLLVAAVIAVFAGIAAMQLSSPAQAPAANVAAQAPSPGVATIDVIVAKAPIAPGTIITPAMIDRQPWPENLVLDGFIVGNSPAANTLVGKVARSPFQAREPLITTKLAASNDTGFLAANLPKGLRAITLATDAISGVAGFVYPGDHIDIVFTHNVPQDIRAAAAGPAQTAPGAPAAAASAEKPGFAEVLATNIPVLAINLRDNAGENAGGVAGAVSNAVSSVAPSSMTLQVTDIQAEKIRLAEKVGTLSVVLRSINDREDNNVSHPTDLMSLTQINTQAAAAPQDNSVRVVRGGDNSASGDSGLRVQGGR